MRISPYVNASPVPDGDYHDFREAPLSLCSERAIAAPGSLAERHRNPRIARPVPAALDCPDLLPLWPSARAPSSPRASTPTSRVTRTASLTAHANVSRAFSACSVAPSVASLASSLSSVISRVSAAHRSSNMKPPVFPSLPANSLSLSRSPIEHLAPRRVLQLGVAHPPPAIA